MSDDDDVIGEGSPLHEHLKEVGFVDVFAESLDPGQETLSVTRKKLKNETIDCDVIEEVLALRAANLLFEDDLDHVDCIFANFELAKNESYRFMFKGKASAVVLAFGLLCYMYIGIYAFALVSIYYAYRTAEYLWRKHSRLKRFKRLITVLQANFSLLVRVYKFVLENERLLLKRLVGSTGHHAIQVLKGLKADFSLAQQEINNVLSRATITLIEKVPLCDFVENPDCYLCKNIESYSRITKPASLHNSYMLLQSQFLSRLIFSLIPNLLANDKNKNDIITDIVKKVTFQVHEIQKTLNKKFKIILTNGLCLDEPKSARPLPRKARRANTSQNTIVNNLNDLSNSLQFSLIKSRELENGIQTNKPSDIELELNTLRKELSSCLSHLDDILLVHQKENINKGETSTIPEEIVHSEGFKLTELGFPNLDPEVDDDIFEAVTDIVEEVKGNVADDFDEDIDILSKKQQTYVLAELKGRLAQQAEDWAKREALVVARKGLSPTEKVAEISKECPLTNIDDDHLYLKLNKKLQKPRKRNKYRYRNDLNGDSTNNENINFRTKPEKAYGPEGVSIFAQSLHQRHSKIVPSLKEDNYCGSGENSEEE